MRAAAIMFLQKFELLYDCRENKISLNNTRFLENFAQTIVSAIYATLKINCFFLHGKILNSSSILPEEKKT
jgi:hypothetical protein